MTNTPRTIRVVLAHIVANVLRHVTRTFTRTSAARAQTSPTYPSLPTQPYLQTGNSPTIHTSSTSTRDPRPDMDGQPQISDRAADAILDLILLDAELRGHLPSPPPVSPVEGPRPVSGVAS